MDDETIKSHLKIAFGTWVIENPYELARLAVEYSTSGNRFIWLVESAFYGALDDEHAESTLELAVQEWVTSRGEKVHEERATSINPLVRIAEGIVFDAIEAGRKRDAELIGPSIPMPPQKRPVPAKLKWDVLERDDFTCQHCSSRRYLSIDHIIPEAKNGPTEEYNLQTLCLSCNRKKGTRSNEEALRRLGRTYATGHADCS